MFQRLRGRLSDKLKGIKRLSFNEVAENIEQRIAKTYLKELTWDYTSTYAGRQVSLVERKTGRYLVHMRPKDKVIAIYAKSKYFGGLVEIVEEEFKNGNVKYNKSDAPLTSAGKPLYVSYVLEK